MKNVIIFNGQQLETSTTGAINSKQGLILSSYLSAEQWKLLGYDFPNGKTLNKRISSGKMLFFEDSNWKEVRIFSNEKAEITSISI